MIVLDQATPCARKAHRCDFCSRTVEPGETYSRHRLIGDDGPYSWKQCAHCTALVRLYLNDFCWDTHEGYAADDVWERDWVETVHQARCRVMFLRGWRRRDGALYPLPTPPASLTSERPERPGGED